VKVKVTPEQAMEAQRRSIASSFLSLTSTLDGVGGQRHTPAALRLVKTRCPLYRRLGGSPGPFWTGAENIAVTGIRSFDRPARSKSLYRLSYLGPQRRYIMLKIKLNVGFLSSLLSTVEYWNSFTVTVFYCLW
jgi:hypothetical protein